MVEDMNDGMGSREEPYHSRQEQVGSTSTAKAPWLFAAHGDLVRTKQARLEAPT